MGVLRKGLWGCGGDSCKEKRKNLTSDIFPRGESDPSETKTLKLGKVEMLV